MAFTCPNGHKGEPGSRCYCGELVARISDETLSSERYEQIDLDVCPHCGREDCAHPRGVSPICEPYE